MKLVQAIKWLLITAISSVLLLEALLQVGAILIKDSRNSANAFLSVGNTLRVLTIGDSHTYGLYLTAEEAYPSQLKKIWDTTAHERDIEVINVGFPGTNSSRVLSNIHSLLDTFKPDVIVLLVGINDYWTHPVSKSDTNQNTSALIDWLSNHSRVYKLLYMLQRQMYNANKLEIDDKFRGAKWDPAHDEAFKKKTEQSTNFTDDIPNAVSYGDKEFSIGFQASAIQRDKPMQHLYKNLLDIIAATQQHNVRLILMTYENDKDLLFQTVNTQVRKAAQKQNITPLELAPTFSQQCPDLNACALLFPDFHPTATGQAEIAKQVMRVLLND